MKTINGGFFLSGQCDNSGYINIRDLPQHEATRKFIDYLWRKYSYLADPHFREDAKNHFLERFWEMYLAVTFIEHVFELHRTGN